MEGPGPNGETVTTDKSDYSPGETVVISGTGWTANQEVALHIDDSNGVARFDTSVMADGAGNISNSEFVIQPEDVGLAFTLTATQGAVTAWTQFTELSAPDSRRTVIRVDSRSTVICGQRQSQPKNRLGKYYERQRCQRPCK